MSPKKSASSDCDKATAKSVQELLAIRKEHEKKISDVDKSIQERLQEEFHEVWEDSIRPALEHFKDTAEELVQRFSEFEDDFRGYLRDREPDFDVDLLAEIYGDTLKAKAGEPGKQPQGKRKQRSPEMKEKILEDYERAKEEGLGGQYLKTRGLNYSTISNWKRSLKKAAEAAEAMSDKP